VSALDALVRTSLGNFDLDVALRVEAGMVVAVLGPNGAGKSTVLRVLAGLQPLTAGHVRLGERVLEAPATGHRVSAQHRGTGLVPQESMLFPHLTVLDQVAFGRRHQGLSRTAARAEAQEWLERTGLRDLAVRRPDQLSGGQARRVAITRALATRPRMLLLDEPLTALDVRAVLELRTFLHRHLRDHSGVTVLVTHDALDAMVLADDLVVLDHGAVVQRGTPGDVARRPRSAHVAALVGLNLVRGNADGDRIRLDAGAGEVDLVATGSHRGAVFASFRPGAVSLHVAQPQVSARNVWPGSVTGLTPHGDMVRVEVAMPGGPTVLADVTPLAVADLELVPGTSVWVSLKATEVQVYDA